MRPRSSHIAVTSLLLFHCGADPAGEHGLTVAGAGHGAGSGSAPSQTGGSTSVPPPTSGGASGGAGRTGGASGLGGNAAGAGGKAGTAGTAGNSTGGHAGGAGVSSSGSGGMSGASACSGKPGALRGKSDQALTAAGLARKFVYYAPSNLSANQPAPIVIVAHGWLQSGQAMYDLTQYHEIADREGFVLMYPDGEPGSIGPWNIGEGACPSTLLTLPVATGDDQAFIDAMIEFAAADQCVDREHIFVTGFSMGGYFTNETGCLRSEIAAIGPHSGGSHDLSACPVAHKPVILFHGMSDTLIPVTCGTEARDRWVEHNGCGSEVESVPVTGGHCEYSKGCPTGGQVALCLFDGMPHGWAGGQESTYGFPEYESAAELGWAFFEKYAW
jgi:polyhydroxybutyrate depolymerase